MRIFSVRTLLFLALLPLSAAADTGDAAVHLPEPGVLELAAIAAVIGLLIARKRGRKDNN